MRAVVYDEYGPPDVLRLEEIPKPVPGPDQVLVEVAATSINLSDWEGLHGTPAYARFGGLRRPGRRVLGSDIAGWVESVGSEVTRFRPGDVVYGDNLTLMGGFADYTVAPESALAHKAAGLTFAEASTLPQAGPIALQGTAAAGPGRRVLINGAGGGSGSFAIQLAARAGAHVTAVDNAGKLDFMRSLGADRVIDYRSEDFAALAMEAGGADAILDVVGAAYFEPNLKALAQDGRLAIIGLQKGNAAQIHLGGLLAKRATITGTTLRARPLDQRRQILAEVFEHVWPALDTGDITPVVSTRLPLAEAAEAHRLMAAGGHWGKIVLTAK
jgi:NADPH:quinone reductase-like Zn-dependent oxidoreductase